MANVDVAKLSKDDKDELVCTYAALLLHDAELPISVSFHHNSPLTLFQSLGRKIEQDH